MSKLFVSTGSILQSKVSVYESLTKTRCRDEFPPVEKLWLKSFWSTKTLYFGLQMPEMAFKIVLIHYFQTYF